MTRITGGLRINGGLNLVGATVLPLLRWDPSYLGPLLQLSQSNTRVIDTGPGLYSVLGTNAIPSSGAYMFTLKIDFEANVPGAAIGVATRGMNISNGIGLDPFSFAFVDDGNAYTDNGPVTGGLPTFVATGGPHIVDIAVLNGTYIWIRVDGGYWNGNASSNLLDGTGGITLPSFGAAIYPAVTCAGAIGPTEFTLLSSASYGVPTGVTFFNMFSPPLTSINPPTIVADSPFGAGSSYVFNGLSQYLIYDAAPLAVGTDWTIEWFQKDTGTNAFPRPFMSTGGFGVSIEGAKTAATFYFWDNGAFVPGSSVNVENVWRHFAISTISGQTTFYMDGVALGASVATGSYAFTGENLQIGAKPGGMDSESFSGNITDFRWTVGVGVYTGNFTVPTSSLQLTQSSSTNIQAITAGQVKLLVKP